MYLVEVIAFIQMIYFIHLKREAEKEREMMEREKKEER